MYEASFGLKRRPFAATPDATCFLSAGPIQAVLDELVVCVEQGQGIAVLTAPAGTGKTLLCERLRFELDDRFETVFLRHSSFLTRRALLQTVLCELNHPYHHPSEQELRLELFPAIRALQPKREALVLICDEAHQLTDSLLEELRILADFAESGRPLVRLVLVGQLSLEEKLTQPSLEAFNQRIRAQVNLLPFDHAGSIDYIDYRVTWSGGRTDEVFTPAALDLIARASDGVPRCINQLADHTLLLAFVAEQQPAGEELVREALGDLRQLPLHWNEPSESRKLPDRSEQKFDEADSQNMPIALKRDFSGNLSGSAAAAAMYSYEPEAIPATNAGWTSLESGTVSDPSVPQMETSFDSERSTGLNRIEVRGDDWRKTVELFNTRSTETVFAAVLADIAAEPVIAATNEQSSCQLTRRMHFHDLLQDAYAAAGKSVLPDIVSEVNNDGEFSRPSSIADAPIKIPVEMPVEAPVDAQLADHRFIESESFRSTNASSSTSLTTQSTTRFYEEVVVDRYAAIDGGLALPPTSQPDTTDRNEVRAEQTGLDEQCSNTSTNETIVETLEHHTFADSPCDFDSRHVDDEYAADAGDGEPVSQTVEDRSVNEISDSSHSVDSDVIETTLLTRRVR